MSYTIRPARPDDYEALAAMYCTAFPGVPHNADEMKEEDEEIQPPLRFIRWVAEENGMVIGSISYFQSQARYHPQKFWLDAAVHHEHQGRGVGGALYNTAIEALAPFDPILVRTYTREDLPHSIRFFERRGFQERRRTWVSHLDLAGFDFSPYAGVEEKVEAQGIQMLPLADLMQVVDWGHRALDLYNTIQLDIPDFDQAVSVPFEQFEQSQIKSSKLMPNGYFVALDGDRWIGMSTLWKGSEETAVHTGLTGVRPDYRRRGIALALKIRSLRYARELGITKVGTNNAASNVGMLAINERLGFAKEPAWIHMVKER